MDMSARNILFVVLFGSDVLGNQKNLFHSIQLSLRQGSYPHASESRGAQVS
jgi:hypothetical protein